MNRFNLPGRNQFYSDIVVGWIRECLFNLLHGLLWFGAIVLLIAVLVR